MSVAPALSVSKTVRPPNFICHRQTLRGTSSNGLYCLLGLADREYIVGSKFETAVSIKVVLWSFSVQVTYLLRDQRAVPALPRS